MACALVTLQPSGSASSPILSITDLENRSQRPKDGVAKSAAAAWFAARRSTVCGLGLDD